MNLFVCVPNFVLPCAVKLGDNWEAEKIQGQPKLNNAHKTEFWNGQMGFVLKQDYTVRFITFVTSIRKERSRWNFVSVGIQIGFIIFGTV